MSLVAEVKDKAEITQILREYLELKPAGSNYRAVCPFHQEKTASLMVSQSKQIWHCFGCGLGGDVFSFIQQIEGLEFKGALRLLANKLGIVYRRQSPEVQNKKDQLLTIHQLAAQFFQFVLLKSNKATSFRQYLDQRGVDQARQTQWQLGAIVSDWDALLKYLTLKKKIPVSLIEEAGLILKNKKGGYFDRFRDRLIFPISNHQGQVVAFGGRSLDPEQPAKYLNSPQTEIYNKSQLLYGLDQAKVAIRQAGNVLIVEGYFDLISLHQFGVKNVVAVSGTALTSEQLKLLKRYTSEIILAFDRDPAGQKALSRSLNLAWQLGLEVKILELPSGTDPDDFIRTDQELFAKHLAESQSVIDYYFKEVFKADNWQQPQFKESATQQLLPLIDALPSPVLKSHYFQLLSDRISIPIGVLKTIKRSVLKKNSLPAAATSPLAPKLVKSRLHLLWERFLSLGLIVPQVWVSHQWFVHSSWSSYPVLQGELPLRELDQLYQLLKKVYTINVEQAGFDLEKVLLLEADLEASLYHKLILLAETETETLNEVETVKEWQICEQELQESLNQFELKHLTSALRSAEAGSDQKRVVELSSKLQKFLQYVTIK